MSFGPEYRESVMIRIGSRKCLTGKRRRRFQQEMILQVLAMSAVTKPEGPPIHGAHGQPRLGVVPFSTGGSRDFSRDVNRF